MPDPLTLPDGLIRAMDEAGLTGEDRRQVEAYARFLALVPDHGQEEAYKRAYGEELWR